MQQRGAFVGDKNFSVHKTVRLIRICHSLFQHNNMNNDKSLILNISLCCGSLDSNSPLKRAIEFHPNRRASLFRYILKSCFDITYMTTWNIRDFIVIFHMNSKTKQLQLRVLRNPEESPHFWIYFWKQTITDEYSYNKSQQDALFFKFILVKNSVSDRLTVHHQESSYCIHSKWYFPY